MGYSWKAALFLTLINLVYIVPTYGFDLCGAKLKFCPHGCCNNGDPNDPCCDEEEAEENAAIKAAIISGSIVGGIFVVGLLVCIIGCIIVGCSSMNKKRTNPAPISTVTYTNTPYHPAPLNLPPITKPGPGNATAQPGNPTTYSNFAASGPGPSAPFAPTVYPPPYQPNITGNSSRATENVIESTTLGPLSIATPMEPPPAYNYEYNCSLGQRSGTT